MKTVSSLRHFVAFTLCVALASTAMAQEKKKATIRGAGIGALLGQALGHDTESTLVGAAVGAGVGHVVGKNKEEKQQAKEAEEAAEAAVAKSAQPATAAEEANNQESISKLCDGIWTVENIKPVDRVPPFFSKTVIFQEDGKVQTVTTSPEGKETLSVEDYTVVGDTIVVEKPKYTVHATFMVDQNKLILSGEDFSAMLRKLKPEK